MVPQFSFGMNSIFTLTHVLEWADLAPKVGTLTWPGEQNEHTRATVIELENKDIFYKQLNKYENKDFWWKYWDMDIHSTKLTKLIEHKPGGGGNVWYYLENCMKIKKTVIGYKQEWKRNRRERRSPFVIIKLCSGSIILKSIS